MIYIFKADSGSETGGISMETKWIDGAQIKVSIAGDTALISANREGLLSLADHLASLADGIPGDHIHYDVYNSLEEGSSGLIIEKAEQV